MIITHAVFFTVTHAGHYVESSVLKVLGFATMCSGCVFGNSSKITLIITRRLFTFIGQSTIGAAIVHVISSIKHVATVGCASLKTLIVLVHHAKISDSRIFEHCSTQSVLSLDARITRPDLSWC